MSAPDTSNANVARVLREAAARISTTYEVAEVTKRRALALADALDQNPCELVMVSGKDVQAWKARWPDGSLAWVRPAESWNDSQRKTAEEAGLTLSSLYLADALDAQSAHAADCNARLFNGPLGECSCTLPVVTWEERVERANEAVNDNDTRPDWLEITLHAAFPEYAPANAATGSGNKEPAP